MKQLIVHSRTINYPIIFEKNLSARLSQLSKKNKLHILIDGHVARVHKGLLKQKKQYASVRIINAVEDKKNIEEVSSYIEYLLKHTIHKDHVIVVIGGGLAQDIGSFVAHVLLRGITWIFIPTTLLAMADSCVGSKSGINVGKYKNQIGTFHPPSQIYIYLPFLKTLPQTEMVNGIGEIVKHAFIKGGKQGNFISKNLSQLQKSVKVSGEIIYQSLLIKKEIVEKDEFEKNLRKVLNYGHTFGHALEGYTKHAIPHGVGVLIGMDIANYISLKKKMLSEKEFKKMHEIIFPYISSFSVKIRDYKSYMDFLSHDKKVVGNEVYAILANAIGKIVIVKTKLDASLKNLIQGYFKEYAK